MPAEIKKPLGILAGEGDLPLILAQHCLAENRDVFAVFFEGCTYSSEWPATVTVLNTRLEKVGDIFFVF